MQCSDKVIQLNLLEMYEIRMERHCSFRHTVGKKILRSEFVSNGVPLIFGG
jgi:hypothetical protein